MNHSKQLLTVLCCFVAFSIFTANYTFAQGQGKGMGQGLLNNTGCENGKGFTTGQGHLNGKSAVDCDACGIENIIAEVIVSIESNGRGTVTGYTITGNNTFDVIVEPDEGGCVIFHFIWTGDPCGEFSWIVDGRGDPC